MSNLFQEQKHWNVDFGEINCLTVPPGDLLWERWLPELGVERGRAHRGRRQQRGAERAFFYFTLSFNCSSADPLQHGDGCGPPLPALRAQPDPGPRGRTLQLLLLEPLHQVGEHLNCKSLSKHGCGFMAKSEAIGTLLSPKSVTCLEPFDPQLLLLPLRLPVRLCGDVRVVGRGRRGRVSGR